MKTKLIEKVKFGKELSELITESGYADVKLKGNSGEEFSNRMIDYIDSYEILYSEIIGCA